MNIKYERLYNYTSHVECHCTLSDINSDALDAFNTALYIKDVNTMFNLLKQSFSTIGITDFKVDMDNNSIEFDANMDKPMIVDNKKVTNIDNNKWIKNNTVKLFKEKINEFIKKLVHFVFSYYESKMTLKNYNHY